MFTSGLASHPIGKSIFVFAGSINHTFKQFADWFQQKNRISGLSSSEENKKEDNYKSQNIQNKNLNSTKGIDFLSRLQGHIDVEGLWPMNENGGPEKDPDENDFFKNKLFQKYAMRRSIVLRDLLLRWAPNIFRTIGTRREANVSGDVVYSFLRESAYLHGIRSMEAVIRMSSLDNTNSFTPECLPPRKQLRMHVSDDFRLRALKTLFSN